LLEMICIMVNFLTVSTFTMYYVRRLFIRSDAGRSSLPPPSGYATAWRKTLIVPV